MVLDWYPNAVHAFIYDAIEKGYYAEEGIKVNVQFPSNTNDAMSLTAAGKAEVGIYYLPDVIMARANQDVPIRLYRSPDSVRPEYHFVTEGKKYSESEGSGRKDDRLFRNRTE